MVHLYVEILSSHLKFCGWIFIDIEGCSQSCQLKRVIWVIKFHVCHSPVLIRIWMCDHRSLEMNVLGALSGSIWGCSFKLLFTCLFFFFFFNYNENMLFCNVKKELSVCALLSPLATFFWPWSSSKMRSLLAPYDLATRVYVLIVVLGWEIPENAVSLTFFDSARIILCSLWPGDCVALRRWCHNNNP